MSRFVCLQSSVQIAGKSRGCHLITNELMHQLNDIKAVKVGLAHFFLQHTSASLSLNENADPDVRKDLEASLNRIVPEGHMYAHDAEGPDDMPAHVKSSLLGCSLSIPITNGALNLGTWQGVYLCEHRNHGGPRTIVVTLQGELFEM
eukprot:TRINITY_DN9896_c0_g1_i1.p1 TRINITY_DN9896_c0_g1~~TRINITY_DN9896_c0_g1_i1.p1  ORF type:complete len:157 (+),score=4.29 TRINITY_DN9896_c0_g1_i1:33-473(+)